MSQPNGMADLPTQNSNCELAHRPHDVLSQRAQRIMPIRPNVIANKSVKVTVPTHHTKRLNRPTRSKWSSFQSIGSSPTVGRTRWRLLSLAGLLSACLTYAMRKRHEASQTPSSPRQIQMRQDFNAGSKVTA